MNGGGNPKNIGAIYDRFDDGELGEANYSGWLDGPEGTPTASGTSGEVRLCENGYNGVRYYQSGDVAYVEVVDPDADSTANMDSMVVYLRTARELTWESLKLYETGASTDTFHSNMTFDIGGVVSTDGNLEVDYGDSVVLRYDDGKDDYGNSVELRDRVTFVNTVVTADIITNDTWTSGGSPYLIANDIQVQSGYTLAIQSGVDVLCDTGVDLSVSGTLQAYGMPGSPVRFVPASYESKADRWGTIYLYSSMVHTLEHCEILQSTYGLYVSGGVSSQSRLANSVIRGCSNTGVFLGGGNSLTIDSCVIDSCDSVGIDLQGLRSGDTLFLRDSRVEYNGGHGLYMHGWGSCYGQWLVMERDTVVGNGGIGVYLYASSCDSVLGTISHCLIGSNGGDGIGLDGWGTTNAVIDSSVIDGNGADGIGAYQHSQLEVTWSEITDHSGGSGIYLKHNEEYWVDSIYEIHNNTVTGNQYGIYADSVSRVHVDGNNLYGNSIYDFYNHTENPQDCRYNYWGVSTTSDMDGGGNPKNIGAIYDFHDHGAMGEVMYAGWLGGGTVNLAPEITSTPVTSAIFNNAYTYDVDAVDPNSDAVTYSLLMNPAGMTINTSTGLVSWTPDAMGDHTVKVGASDATYITNQEYVLTVSGTAPTVTAHPNGDTILVGESATFCVVATGTTPFTYKLLRDGSVVSSGSDSCPTVSSASLADSGVYSVVVDNGIDADTSDTVTLKVVEPVSVTASPSDTAVLLGAGASFTITVAGSGPYTYRWIHNGNDTVGTGSAMTVPSATLADTGCYVCKVANGYTIAYSDAGCLAVVVPPEADFAASTVSGVDSATIVFTDNSSGDIDKWIWDFGDGEIDTFLTSTDPSHFYDIAGAYTVGLTARHTGIGGDSTLVKTDYITIYEKSLSTFSGSLTSGIDTLMVTFELDSVSNGVASWHWDYGDGESDVFTGAADPTHLYTSPGSYDVTLVVTGPGGSDTTTRMQYITVYGKAVAACTSTATTGGAPFAVTFTDQSTGSIDTWAWDFGDGGTSIEQHPSYIYVSPGVYDVSLAVAGPGGADTLLSTSMITVIDIAPPDPVTALTAVAVNCSTAAISWTPSGSSDAETITVCASTSAMPLSDSDGDVLHSLSADGVSDTIFGLEATGVRLYVAAFVIDSNGNVSAYADDAGDSVDLPDCVPPENTMDATVASLGDSAVEVALSISGSAVEPIAEVLFSMSAAQVDPDSNITLSLEYKDTSFVVPGITRQGWWYAAWAPVDPAGNVGEMKSDSVEIANTAPVLTLAASDSLLEDSAWSMTVGVYDLNGDDVSLALSSAGPSGLNLDATAGVLAWTPVNEDVGEHSVVVTADDGYGGSGSATIELLVINTNDAPALISISLPDTLYEDEIVSTNVVAFDEDSGDSLELTMDAAWLMPDAGVPQGGGYWQLTASGTPLDEHTGIVGVTATVTDLEGATSSLTRTVHIVNTNDAPETSIAGRKVAYGAAKYLVEADDDFDTIATYHATLTGIGNSRRDTLVVTGSVAVFSLYPLMDGEYVFACYAVDPDGLSDPSPVIDTLVIRNASSHTFADTGSWQMLSVPVDRLGATPFKVNGHIVHWDESVEPVSIYKYYVRSEAITYLSGGKSYWGKSDSAVGIAIDENSLVTAPTDIILDKAEFGWNQIASPFPYPVAWSHAAVLWQWNAAERDFVAGTDGGVLFPWKGYWVQTDKTDTVSVGTEPVFVTAGLAKRARSCYINRNEWRLNVHLASNINQDSDNLIGLSRHARNGSDAMDRPEPPRMGDEPYAFFAHPEWKRSITEFASDIRRKWEDENIFQIGIAPCSPDVTTLSLSVTGHGDEGPLYVFMHASSGVVVEVEDGTPVSVVPSSAVQYRTAFVTDDPGFLSRFPQKFVMKNPYPNPFRPNVNICYTLPYRWQTNGWLVTDPYRVKVAIYDIRGRMVRELVNRKQKPGEYRVTWNGASNTGRSVASGFYLCRLSAGKHVGIRRLTLLR